MIININIDAMQALRSLNNNTWKTDKTIEKLASGMKINRAVDDAAGLAISVKLRAQIRGLAQDERNIDDGISMFNAAEGGMSQIEDMIHRIRELAVQSASDTNTNNDRAKMQKEVEQLIEGIDRIANDTEFNTHKVLLGEYESVTTTITVPQTVSAYISDNPLETRSVLLAMKRTKVLDSNGKSMGTYFFINGVRIPPATYVTPPALNPEYLPGVDRGYAPFDTYLNRVDPTFQNFLQNGMYDASDKVSTANAQRFIDTIAETMNLIIADHSPTLPKVKGYVFNDPTDSNYGKVGLYLEDGGTIAWGDCAGSAAVQGASIAHVFLHLQYSTNSMATISVPSTTTATINTYVNDYIIQVGANKDQNILFKIPPMPAKVLGNQGPPPKVIADADIGTQSKANDTIALCDIALDYVSDARALMGAHINRLEAAKANVTNYHVNVSAAESRLRDANMAKEIMEQTKLNILTQSATAMLTQANQKPENILQLLR